MNPQLVISFAFMTDAALRPETATSTCTFAQVSVTYLLPFVVTAGACSQPSVVKVNSRKPGSPPAPPVSSYNILLTIEVSYMWVQSPS
jgi:hypothetical protein